MSLEDEIKKGGPTMKRLRDKPPAPAVARATDKPPWVSEKLIEETIRLWSKRSPEPITRQEAIDIIACAGRLIDILKTG